MSMCYLTVCTMHRHRTVSDCMKFARVHSNSAFERSRFTSHAEQLLTYNRCAITETIHSRPEHLLTSKSESFHMAIKDAKY